MAYTLETVLAEKYETIIRRNIGTTRARDFYDLHMLYQYHKDEIRMDILKTAVLHTARKRGSLEEINDWKEVLHDIREEPILNQLWKNYTSENNYASKLAFSKCWIQLTKSLLAEFLRDSSGQTSIQVWEISWNFQYYVERTGFLFLDLVTVYEDIFWTFLL